VKVHYLQKNIKSNLPLYLKAEWLNYFNLFGVCIWQNHISLIFISTYMMAVCFALVQMGDCYVINYIKLIRLIENYSLPLSAIFVVFRNLISISVDSRYIIALDVLLTKRKSCLRRKDDYC
jgi:hypothetical protein